MDRGVPQHYNQPQPVPVMFPAPPPPLGTESQAMQCPYCHHHIRTTVTSEATTKTHLVALVLCLFVCWPCVCLPYCMDSCLSQKHNCPNCKAYLGEHKN